MREGVGGATDLREGKGREVGGIGWGGGEGRGGIEGERGRIEKEREREKAKEERKNFLII